MATTINGYNSGLDIQTIVSSLVAAEKAPKEAQLSRLESATTAKITGIGQLKSAIADLQSVLKDLNKPELFEKWSATSSDSKLVSASASKDALAGSYKIEVSRLATSSKVATAAVSGGGEHSFASGGSLVISMGDEALPAIEVAAGATLKEIRDAINAQLKEQGVNANIVTDPKTNTSQLVLTSSKTGAGNDLTIQAFDADGNPGGDLAALDIPAYDAGNPAAGVSYISMAADAEFSIDGLALKSATNNVAGAIEGVTLNLVATTEAGKPVTLTVDRDKAGVTSTIKKFVDAYNKLMNTAATLTAVASVGEDKAPVGELTVLSTAPGAEEATRRATTIAESVTLVRDLVNTPPSDLWPARFAEIAVERGGEAGLSVEVLDETELKEGGYGGLIAVGQGSARPPRLVRIAYRHPEATTTLAYVGKGITFDSGGLSLKPTTAMDWMKSDMGGAGAVLGSLIAIARLGLKVNVIGYLCLAENMPSGTAQRPSDVITTFGGKTVEVLNTDAEGRLVLADGLGRAAQDSPDVLVDVATLTGAQIVALGNRTSGVMANDDRLREEVVEVATAAGEPAWGMPLPEELRKSLDSSVADIANVHPDRVAGMLAAGVFLREFVPDGLRWAHLDIAGPAFHRAEPNGYTPKGGTGAATRTLIGLAARYAK